MSSLEEKLNILKKKKLTAKSIVEEQRNEIRLLKSSLTLNERLEEIFRRFDDPRKIDQQLYRQLTNVKKDRSSSSSSHEQIHRAIDDLSKLIEHILSLLSIHTQINLNSSEADVILQKHKECFQLIKWKLSDIYANRIADEVSCITS